MREREREREREGRKLEGKTGISSNSSKICDFQSWKNCFGIHLSNNDNENCLRIMRERERERERE